MDGPLMDEQVVHRTCHPSYRLHTPAGQGLELVRWVEVVAQHELEEHEEVLGSLLRRPRTVVGPAHGLEQVEEQHEGHQLRLWSVVEVELEVEEERHEEQEQEQAHLALRCSNLWHATSGHPCG